MNEQFCVRVKGTEDYCLMWGDGSPRWRGSRESAEDRALKMTATSWDRTEYEVVPAADDGDER